MKLRRIPVEGQKRKTRKDKALDLTSVKSEREKIDDRLGLTPALKRKMIEAPAYGVLAKRETEKGRSLTYLLSLVPAERSQLLQRFRELKLKDVAEPDSPWDRSYQMEALDLLKQMGEEVVLDQRQKEWLVSKMVIANQNPGWSEMYALKTRVSGMRLLEQGELPPIDPALDDWIKRQDWEDCAKYAGGFLTQAGAFLEYDPSLHSKLHAITLEHEAEFRRVLNRLGEDSEPESRHRLIQEFAAFKLLLADQIEVTPTGLLVPLFASELKKGPGLPDRKIV